MRVRDIVAEARPTVVTSHVCGGMLGCPSQCEELSQYKIRRFCIERDCDANREVCQECWDQEAKITMTNKEFYADKLIEIAIRGERLAISNGELKDCSTTPCNDCKFYGCSCKSARKNWAEEEYVEPKKPKVFSHAERTILKALDPKMKYIARDNNGRLWVYTEKPLKKEKTFRAYFPHEAYELVFKEDLFKQITWEDAEAISIKEITND